MVTSGEGEGEWKGNFIFSYLPVSWCPFILVEMNTVSFKTMGQYKNERENFPIPQSGLSVFTYFIYT